MWCGVVTLSILAAMFLVTYNLNEFLSSFTVTTLQSSTEDLENIYFPSVTICNRNQIRSRLFNTQYKAVWLRMQNKLHLFYRDTWWKNIGLPGTTDMTRKKVVSNFYTGAKIFTDNQQMAQLVGSDKVQKEFCSYMEHTSEFSC